MNAKHLFSTQMRKRARQGQTADHDAVFVFPFKVSQKSMPNETDTYLDTHTCVSTTRN